MMKDYLLFENHSHMKYFGIFAEMIYYLHATSKEYGILSQRRIVVQSTFTRKFRSLPIDGVGGSIAIAEGHPA